MENDLPEDYDPLAGVITDYTQIEKAPVFEYDNNNNAIIFKNKIIPEVGITSSGTNTISFFTACCV